MKHPKIILAGLLATVLALPAVAQPDRQSQRPDRQPRQEGPGHAPPLEEGQRPEHARGPDKARRDPGAKRARFEHLRAKVLRKRAGLSEDKAAEVVALLEDRSEARRAARARMQRARRALEQLFRSDSDDQNAWAAALDDMAKARSEMQALRTAQYRALEEVLAPKERAMLLRTMHRVRTEMTKRRFKGPKKRNQRGGPPRRQGPGEGPGKRRGPR